MGKATDFSRLVFFSFFLLVSHYLSISNLYPWSDISNQFNYNILKYDKIQYKLLFLSFMMFQNYILIDLKNKKKI